MTGRTMDGRVVIYPMVYAVVAASAYMFSWFTRTPFTTGSPELSAPPPLHRAERKQQPVRVISAERQAELEQHLSKGIDWKTIEKMKTFGAEQTEAINQAMAAGDHTKALALVMEEIDHTKRSEGLNAVFKSWALADPAEALAALVKLQDPPPQPNSSQFSAALGYFHGLNAGLPGTLETRLPEALRMIPYDQAAQAFFGLSCEHLLITGRVDGARLMDWWKEATRSRPDLKLGDGVVSLAKAVVDVNEQEKKGHLQASERLAIHAGLVRAIEALPEGDRSTTGVADWLIHMTGGLEDRHTSLDAYETPSNPATQEIYMRGAALKFAQDLPAEVLSLIATAKDDTDRAKADSLWSGYISHRARQRSTLNLMMEFSSSAIPPDKQQSAAKSVVNRKMGEDSILLTTLVNDLPENALKDAYRLHIADWLQKNGHKGDAEMWRNSIHKGTSPSK
jgi:hypothetical protein